jgi:hypothetical protein
MDAGPAKFGVFAKQKRTTVKRQGFWAAQGIGAEIPQSGGRAAGAGRGIEADSPVFCGLPQKMRPKEHLPLV